MNKFLTLAAVLCMSASTAAFAANEDTKGSADAVKAQATEAAKPATDAAKSATEAKDAMDAKSVNAMEAKAEAKPYKEVTAAELKAMLDKKQEVVIIDARDKKTFDKGHLEGAVNLTPSEINEASLAKVAKSKDTTIAFYCGSTECAASSKAAKEASELGYKNLVKVPGGYAEWTKEGYKTTTKM